VTPAAPALAVFLKAPRLGTVKTRLAATIGDGPALELYRRMVTATLETARAAALEVTIWYAPADAGDEMRAWLGDEWSYRPQPPGDLGVRLALAARSVEPGLWLAVGADCPGLTSGILREAAGIVAHGRITLGPTQDGGYYLIGGPTPLPDLFSDIPWSTSDVLRRTRARLEQAGATWCELPLLRDVDTEADARAAGLLT
jgi:uncharacterized protein